MAFIGISNWALDPAKMNRGIMVTRCDPTREELELSARCISLLFLCLTVHIQLHYIRQICSNDEDDGVAEWLDPYFHWFAGAYIDILKQQKSEFFGLRDFYRFDIN